METSTATTQEPYAGEVLSAPGFVELQMRDRIRRCAFHWTAIGFLSDDPYDANACWCQLKGDNDDAAFQLVYSRKRVLELIEQAAHAETLYYQLRWPPQ